MSLSTLRRLALPALSAVALATSASAQTSPVWEELATSPFHPYRSEDVVFVGDRGYAVNGSGEAWRTLDGGTTWALTASLDGYLRATGFATADVGWAGVLFSPRRLYETRNGGTTYSDVTARIQPAVPGGICGMWVSDSQTAYAVGQYSGPAYLIKTTDGGATWASRRLEPLVNALVDVLFFDGQNGLALGAVGSYSNGTGRARVIGTTDGGATWTERHTLQGVNGLGWKLTFPSRLVGYASVETFDGEADAHVLKTVDGGLTWAEITVPGGGALQGLGFATPEVGWASGRGTTSVTTDGGLTWARLPPTGSGGQLDGDVNRFRFYGDSLGFAAGHKIYRLSGRFPTAGAGAPAADGAEGLTVLAPNPARGPVTVGYRVASAGAVRVDVFDVRGRRVALLVDGPSAAGDHVATWDPGTAAPGLYVVRMRAGSGVWSRSVSVVGRR